MVNPRYKFTFNREKVGWGEEVRIEVYDETEKGARGKAVALTDRDGHDRAYKLVSVEEVDCSPNPESVTY